MITNSEDADELVDRAASSLIHHQRQKRVRRLVQRLTIVLLVSVIVGGAGLATWLLMGQPNWNQFVERLKQIFS